MTARTPGWRGFSGASMPQWKLQARKATTIARTKGFGMGGLPRKNRPAPISLAPVRCADEKVPR